MGIKIIKTEFGLQKLCPFSLLMGIVIGAMLMYGILDNVMVFIGMYFGFVITMIILSYRLILNDVRKRDK